MYMHSIIIFQPSVPIVRIKLNKICVGTMCTARFISGITGLYQHNFVTFKDLDMPIFKSGASSDNYSSSIQYINAQKISIISDVF